MNSVIRLIDQEQEVPVILKVREPDTASGHMGPTSLACELACSILARSLGINVPDYFVVTVTRQFVEAIDDPRVRTLLASNLGQNFGSLYHRSHILWNADDRATSDDGLEFLEDIMAFDATVINGDRWRTKPNLLWDGESFLAIDHSLALPMALWSDDLVQESPLFPEDYVRRHVAFRSLQNRARAFLAMLQRWQISEQLAADIRAFIPPSWERTAGDLDKIFSFLVNRHAKRGTEIPRELARIIR